MRGFTLIEVILYIALFGTMISASLTTLYPLLSSIEKQNAHTSDTTEVAFVLQKITWLIVRQKTIDMPKDNATSSTLRVTTRDAKKYSIRQQGTSLEMSIDGHTFIPLTRSGTMVENFIVTHVPESSAHLRTVHISFSLNGIAYGPLSYESLY